MRSLTSSSSSRLALQHIASIAFLFLENHNHSNGKQKEQQQQNNVNNTNFKNNAKNENFWWGCDVLDEADIEQVLELEDIGFQLERVSGRRHYLQPVPVADLLRTE